MKSQTSIKECIFYLITVVGMLYLASCTKDDVLRLEEFGTVSFAGTSFNPNAGKTTDYVVCSDELPVKIQYHFIDEQGQNRFKESPIALDGNNIQVLNDVRLPTGLYTANDIALIADSGTVTHRIPNTLTDELKLARFVSLATPFLMNVEAGGTTMIEAEVLCYTAQEIDLGGELVTGGKIVDLVTMYFDVPDCITRVTVEQTERIVVDIQVEGGVYGVPILKDAGRMIVRAYAGTELMSSHFRTSYNPDGVLDAEDVINFNVNCN